MYKYNKMWYNEMTVCFSTFWKEKNNPQKFYHSRR